MFVDVNVSWIKPNSLQVSFEGKVKDTRGVHNPDYLSTNGRMYTFVQTPDDKLVLKPFDIIMASTFIPVPDELRDKQLIVRHKNNILSDCNADNLEWIEDVEEWVDIVYKDIKPGYYQVSNHGRIRSVRYETPMIMKTDNSSGYERVNLRTNGVENGKRHYSVHRLVALHFIPGYTQERNHVNHIDCDHFNNSYQNLEWVSIMENIKHAIDSGVNHAGSYGDDNPCSKISEQEAIKICYSLNKNHGSLIDTYNELKDLIPTVTYPIITMIKYGETFTYISDKILTDEGRKKQIRQTDPDVIIEAAQCLKKYNGDVKKTKKEFGIKYPWVTYSWLWHLKDKSVASEITDQVFTKDEFPKTIPLTESDALMIIESLLKHKGEDFINQTVYDELKDKIEGLSKDKVRAIKEKKSWKTLSDKYFTKEEFIR